MQHEKKDFLKNFFSAPNWLELKERDENRFLDFIIDAFKSNEYSISFEDMKKILEEIYDNDITEEQIDALSHYDSKFKDGIYLLSKYKNS